MLLRYLIWEKTRDGHIAPIACLSPAGITSSEVAREDATRVVLAGAIRAHSLSIETEDGLVIEQWLWRKNKWKPGPAPEPGLTGVLLQRLRR